MALKTRLRKPLRRRPERLAIKSSRNSSSPAGGRLQNPPTEPSIRIQRLKWNSQFGSFLYLCYSRLLTRPYSLILETGRNSPPESADSTLVPRSCRGSRAQTPIVHPSAIFPRLSDVQRTERGTRSACAIKSPTRLGVGFQNADAQLVPRRHRTISSAASSSVFQSYANDAHLVDY